MKQLGTFFVIFYLLCTLFRLKTAYYGKKNNYVCICPIVLR
jgi:hypothetical protein